MTKTELNQKLADVVLLVGDLYLDDNTSETLNLLSKGEQTRCEIWPTQVRLGDGLVEISIMNNIDRPGTLGPARAFFVASGGLNEAGCRHFVELAQTVRMIVGCWQWWVDEYNAGVKR